MKRSEKVILSYWLSNLIELEKSRPIHDMKNLMEVNGRLLVGLDSSDLAEEANYALDYFVGSGYLEIEESAEQSFRWHGQNISNKKFLFTQKFHHELEQKKRKQERRKKIETIKQEVLLWSSIIAAIAAVASVIIQVF